MRRATSSPTVELEGADHFDVIDVAHGAWTIVIEWVVSRLDV